jgi:hypothetical protein
MARDGGERVEVRRRQVGRPVGTRHPLHALAGVVGPRAPSTAGSCLIALLLVVRDNPPT